MGMDREVMERIFDQWEREDAGQREYSLAYVIHDALTSALRPERVRGPIVLGSGRRPAKGKSTPKPNNNRAKVKAARKANRRRKSS